MPENNKETLEIDRKTIEKKAGEILFVEINQLQTIRNPEIQKIKGSWRDFLIKEFAPLNTVTPKFYTVLENERQYEGLMKIFKELYPRASRETEPFSPYMTLMILPAVESKCHKILGVRWPFNLTALPIYDTLMHFKRAITDNVDHFKETSRPYGDHIIHTCYVAILGYLIMGYNKYPSGSFSSIFRKRIQKAYFPNQWINSFNKNDSNPILDAFFSAIGDIDEDIKNGVKNELYDLFFKNARKGTEFLWFTASIAHDLGYYVFMYHHLFHLNKIHPQHSESITLLPTGDSFKREIIKIRRSQIYKAFKAILDKVDKDTLKYFEICEAVCTAFLSHDLNNELYENFWKKMGALHSYFSTLEVLAKAKNLDEKSVDEKVPLGEKKDKLHAYQYCLILCARAILKHHFLAWDKPKEEMNVSRVSWKNKAKDLIGKDHDIEKEKKKAEKAFNQIEMGLYKAQKEAADNNKLSFKEDPLAYLLLVLDSIEEIGEMKTILSPFYNTSTSRRSPLPLFIKRAPDNRSIIVVSNKREMILALITEELFDSEKTKRYEFFEEIINDKNCKIENDYVGDPNVEGDIPCPIFVDLPYEARRVYTELQED
jgi:hypothetical protein